MSAAFDLFFPATSANLGPAFDTAGLAMNFGLRVRAELAKGERDEVAASGRDAEVCGNADNHLVLNVYRAVYAEARGVAPNSAPGLALTLDNAGPIGKGCGSSAAARLAGVALAAHFGELGWDAQRVFETAARLEGHPDNVAACWWGGLVISRATERGIDCLPVPAGAAWTLLMAVPAEALSTEDARRVLPATYSRSDAVANIQNALLLIEAWRQGRGDLLATALSDRLHQPYRAPLCPLLPALAPLAGHNNAAPGGTGILGVALSGAGPSVLMIVEPGREAAAQAAARTALRAAGLEAELLPAEIATAGPGTTWRRS